MDDPIPDRRSIIAVIAELDRTEFHPQIYDDLSNEGNND